MYVNLSDVNVTPKLIINKFIALPETRSLTQASRDTPRAAVRKFTLK
jgi:hypothetical protein